MQAMPNGWLNGGWPNDGWPIAPAEDPDFDKIRKTINWYNKHGTLKKPIYLKDVEGPLRSVGTSQALQILKNLESKADTIENPTAWVLGFVGKIGGGEILHPAAEELIGRQVARFNKNAETGKLSYLEVAGPLARLQQKDAMRILRELEEKRGEVRDPTRWTVGYARFEEKCSKLQRTASWYNQNVKLQQPIQVDEILRPLGSLETWQAMSLLKDLGKKADQIKDPTAWLCAAALRWKKEEQDTWAKDAAEEGEASLIPESERPADAATSD